MLSEHKVFLRVAETVGALGALTSLWFAFRLYREPTSDLPIDLALIAGFALLMLSFLPACILGGEYVRTVRRPQTYREQAAGLSAGELSALLRWAPVVHKAAAVLGIAISVAAALIFGSVSWSSHDPPTPRDGIAGALYLAFFFLLALPVVASAARMPGSYAANFNNDA